MESTDDTLLLKQLKTQSTQREAFEKVVNLYSERLYWQIRRMVLSHDDTNDILQNTFLKAWNGIDSFRSEAKLSTWLYRIAMNESLSFIQRRKKEVTIDDPEINLKETLMSDEYFDGDETDIMLQQAISKLPEKQRLVFNMKYFQEMKYEEISEILTTSVGALKASYHLAVKKIEDFFSQHD